MGVTGTNYVPLDSDHLIKGTMIQMCNLVNSKQNIFEKALLLLVLLSYIQAFDDGNKRTARIVSNACLIHYQHCPISFRTVNPIEYKKAMLLFYEQNNISAFRNLFIGQFEFAVNTYFRELCFFNKLDIYFKLDKQLMISHSQIKKSTPSCQSCTVSTSLWDKPTTNLYMGANRLVAIL